MILFIQQIDIEGPETLGVFFAQSGFKINVVRMDWGESLPGTIDGIEAVIVLGGPMNVYEEEKYPFLKAEDFFIRKVLENNIPYLGLCLGAQLLAKACDAKVKKSPYSEIGFCEVCLTSDGQADKLFKSLEKKLCVYQWHEDMFEIPSNGVLLAQSDKCPHQAFRVGDNAYGLQFHMEITDNSIAQWSDRYYDADNLKHAKHRQAMLDDYRKYKNNFNQIADQIYNNFLAIIRKQMTHV